MLGVILLLRVDLLLFLRCHGLIRVLLLCGRRRLGRHRHARAGQRTPGGVLGDVPRRRANVDPGGIAGLDFNLVAWWQERVEADDQVWMSLEEVGNSVDHSRGVNAKTRTIHNRAKVKHHLSWQSQPLLFPWVY